jgi:hypothetical protein
MAQPPSLADELDRIAKWKRGYAAELAGLVRTPEIEAARKRAAARLADETQARA